MPVPRRVRWGPFEWEIRGRAVYGPAMLLPTNVALQFRPAMPPPADIATVLGALVVTAAALAFAVSRG